MDQDLDECIFGGHRPAPTTRLPAAAAAVCRRWRRAFFRAARRRAAGRQCPAHTGRWHVRTVEIRRFY